MVNTLLAVATLFIVLAAYHRQKKLIVLYQKLLKNNFSIKELLEKIAEGNQNIAELINNSVNLHNWYVPSVKYLLVALSKYIEEMKNQAVKDERYEEAKKCNEALLEMYKLINA